jgi:hypothetical protein
MGWVVNATPRPLYPRKKEPVLDARWAQGKFDPRTVQPVAICYTDYAFPAYSQKLHVVK